MTTRSTVKKPGTADKATATSSSKAKAPAKPVVSKPAEQSEVINSLPSRRVWPD